MLSLPTDTASGDAAGSILFKAGQAIEPVTMLFGMKWQTFTAFIASSLGKEGALGVLSTIYSGVGTITVSSMQATTRLRLLCLLASHTISVF